MFNTQIFLIVLVLPFLAIGTAYAIFPRKTKNLLCRIIPAWNKRYVVCHVQFQGGLKEEHLVVPNPEGLTQVGRYSYALKDKYSILKTNNRLHFILDENDTIPRHFEPQTNDLIIFQASEIQTALDNTVMDYLFSKKKELLLIGLFILGIIAVGAIIYNIYSLNDLKTLIVQHGATVKV